MFSENVFGILHCSEDCLDLVSIFFRGQVIMTRVPIAIHASQLCTSDNKKKTEKMLPHKFQIIAKIDENDEFLSENGQIGLKNVSRFLSHFFYPMCIGLAMTAGFVMYTKFKISS